MAWLCTLGLIHDDFSIPSITFTHNDKSITLKGDSTSHSTHTTFHQLCQLIHTNYVSFFHLLTFQPIDSPPTYCTTPNSLLDPLPPDLDHKIHTLIHNYPTIFQPHSGLPPKWPHDHHIPLAPNTPPINISHTVTPTRKRKQWPQLYMIY